LNAIVRPAVREPAPTIEINHGDYVSYFQNAYTARTRVPGRYTPASVCRRADMTRELREDPYVDEDDEGGDIGEGLSNQPPNEDDTPNE
jgi:hypothetical protein